MNYNILSYLIGEGFKNVFKNKKSTFAALIIMFATMITIGLGIAGAQNITSIVKQLEKDVPITLYVNDGLTTSELNEIEDFIKSLQAIHYRELKEKFDEEVNRWYTYDDQGVRYYNTRIN